MNDAPLYPLLFEPVYKDYLWGGDRIRRVYRPDAPAGVVAESWEIADHPDGMSVVVNGPLRGRTLAELDERMGERLLGSRCPGRRFPLLIKLIDSRDRLSVQVHPDDASAAQFGGEAKTEMWYLLDADPGARVFAGLRPGTDRARFEQALRDHTFEDCLKAIPVRKGEAVFIPGGRVHAIDAGCFILEVQQNSNTTYRVYDWGRVGADGRPRALHVEEALRVMRWDDPGDPRVRPGDPRAVSGGSCRRVLTTPYFILERFDLHGPGDYRTEGESFHAWFVAEGALTLTAGGRTERLPAGTSCLAPAGVVEYAVRPEGHGATALRVTLPPAATA